MRMTVSILALAGLLTLMQGQSFALESIELVTVSRAEALGFDIVARAAGPDLVRVELEFAIDGELEHYRQVVLELRDENKLLLTSAIKEEETKPGRVKVSFATSRARLKLCSLRVVSQDGQRTRIGRVIAVKDFVDLEELR